jgi:hypothetical protein
MPRCLLLTQSGHQPAGFAAAHSARWTIVLDLQKVVLGHGSKSHEAAGIHQAFQAAASSATMVSAIAARERLRRFRYPPGPKSRLRRRTLNARANCAVYLAFDFYNFCEGKGAFMQRHVEAIITRPLMDDVIGACPPRSPMSVRPAEG